MKILLLGSGGREHALAWKLAQSPRCAALYIGPGNAGTQQCGQNVEIDPNDFEQVSKFCLKEAIDMVVVGPEEPLVRGITDHFNKDINLRKIMVVGPAKSAAALEGSKAYAKEFMADMDIPTAQYQSFGKDQLEAGLKYIEKQSTPVVLKADGLAAGKGVLICKSLQRAKAEFEHMLRGKFGTASEKVVIESFLNGIEFSVFVLTDGLTYKILPVAKDYKRIGENDTGLNTGGMGAVSPPPFVDEELMQKVENQIIKPTIEGMQKRGLDYKGFIFFGLINVKGDPFVIEYNCRMGDPEAEVVIPRIKNDLAALLEKLMRGQLESVEIETDPRSAATVMLVSGGYPGKYEKGKAISGLEKVAASIPFHAGTKMDNGKLVTNGGRVLAITSFGDSYRDALAISNRNAQVIQFDGKYFRGDIGFDLIENNF